MNLLYAFLIFSSAVNAGPRSPKSEAEAEAVAESLLIQLGVRAGKLSPPETRLQFSGCEKVAPARWARLLLLGEPIRHEYRFAKFCDVEGPVVFTPGEFPVDLKARLTVKKDEAVKRVRARIRVEVTPQILSNRVAVRLRVTEGRLFSKFESSEALLKFSADYALALDLTGAVRENPGGTVSVTEYQSEPQKIAIPIKVTN